MADLTTHAGAADTAPDKRRKKSRRNLSTAERVAVGAIAAAAFVAGALSGCEPTGTPVVDQVLSGAVPALTALAGARARRWTLATGAAVAAVGAASWVSVFPALALLAVGWLYRIGKRSHVVGAAVGGVVGTTVLFIPWDGPFTGASALVAAVAVVPILVSGWRHARRPVRRAVSVATITVAAVAGVAVLLAGVAGLTVRTDATAAVDRARDGLAAAEDGDVAAAADAFDEAAQGFDRIESRLGAWWALPARAVPVVSQNVQAVTDVAADGQRLAVAGAAAARQADVETLQLRAGALEPARIAAMEPALIEVTAALEGTLGTLDGLSSPWVAGPLRGRLDSLEAEILDAQPDAELAVQAVQAAPALLGGDGEKSYFVAVVTPAEARGLGGFMGNWAQLTANDGQLSLARTGRTGELTRAMRDTTGTPRLTGPPDYLSRYGELDRSLIWSNLTLPPDLPTVADVTSQLYPQSGGGRIDGMIVIDPAGLAALLELTGPVPVEGIDEPLSAENAEQLLLVDQYALFEGDDEARVDLLANTTDAVFDRLLEIDLPGPRGLGDALGPAVAGGHIQVLPFDPQARALFERWDATGAMPAVDGDYLQVVTQNAGNSKIDVYMHRSVQYGVSVDPVSGAVRGSVFVTIRNDATPDLPEIVTNNNRDLPDATSFLWLNVYTPLELRLASIDGQVTTFATQVELDRYVHWAFVEIPPGQEIQVRLDLGGQVALPGGRYQLTLGRQPLVNPDEVTVNVLPPPGITTGDAEGGFEVDPVTGTATWALTVTEPATASVGFDARPAATDVAEPAADTG